MKIGYEVVQYYVVFIDCYDDEHYKIFFNEDAALDFLDFISDKAHEFKRKRGGVIKILNITDYSENW